MVKGRNQVTYLPFQISAPGVRLLWRRRCTLICETLDRSITPLKVGANSLASNPSNPRADEDRDGSSSFGRKAVSLVGSWRGSQVVLFKLFARTAELRESLF